MRGKGKQMTWPKLKEAKKRKNIKDMSDAKNSIDSQSSSQRSNEVRMETDDAVTAVDEENGFEISVTKGNESYCQSEEEEDGELSDNRGDEESISPESEQTNVGNSSIGKEAETTSEQIKEIDRQLAVKLKELEELMAGKKDLTETNAALNKCIEMHSKGMKNRQDEEEESQTHKQQTSFKQGEDESSGNGNCNNTNNTNSNRKINFRLKELNNKASDSIETIYKDAVEKRTSSSSEEGLVDELIINKDCGKKIINADYFTGEDSSDENYAQEDEGDTMEAEAGSSGYNCDRARSTTPRRSRTRTRSRSRSPPLLSAEEKADRMIWEAEEAKAKLFTPQGRCRLLRQQLRHNEYKFTVKIDEDYSVIGGHVDSALQQKIARGEYIDFGRLIPKDKMLPDDDTDRFELTVKNGKTYWSPVTETVNINKREQAFQVYSNIYNQRFPHKATKLIQYNHVIHSISLMYTWDNVYAYDKDFRMHLSKHTERPWNLILHQAWFLRLKDRIQGENRYNTPTGRGARIEEPCRRFNRGRCNFGLTYKYDHRCSYCNKFGHSFVNCRKAVADKDRRARRDDSCWDRQRRDNTEKSMASFRQADDRRNGGGRTSFERRTKLKNSSLKLINVFVVFVVSQDLVDTYTDLNWNNIVTPIKIDQYQYWLEKYEYPTDKINYLLNGFKCGFDIGHRGPLRRKSNSQNIPLSVGSHLEIWNKVIKEVRMGRFS